MNAREMTHRPRATTAESSGLGARAGADIATTLTVLLADMFALYIKTKNFHWHVSTGFRGFPSRWQQVPWGTAT